MSEFFTEVDEALKQERLEKLWKDYGSLFITFLAMIVLATAANAGYHAWIQHRDYKQTALYLDVLNKPAPAADDLLEILPKMTPGMKSVASMSAAGIALENGDSEKALSIYKSIHADPSQQKNNPLLSALAKYMITGLDKEISTEDKIKSYEAMAAEENNPWRFNALLDAALIEATQNNNYGKARAYLGRILAGNSNAPQGMKQKAQSLEILYQAQQSDNQ